MIITYITVNSMMSIDSMIIAIIIVLITTVHCPTSGMYKLATHSGPWRLLIQVVLEKNDYEVLQEIC